MKQYYNWQGSRKDLMQIIVSFEKKDPRKYKMYSKKLNEFLPVTLRRLQQFTDRGILPSGELNNKEFFYNSEHFFRYMAAIKLKNSGHTLVQVEKILNGMQLDEIIEKFLDGESINKSKSIDTEMYLINKSNLPEKLRKIGREEGRVLRSQWLKFAITKWCHLEVKKKELKRLTQEDIETLALALKETLTATSKLKNIDRSIG